MKLAGCHQPPSEVLGLRNLLNPADFTFAVTIAYDTDDIERMAICTIKLPL